MQILERGKHKMVCLKRLTVKVFICSHCECKFKANESEYKTEADENLVVHWCKCPDCGGKAFPDER